MVYEKLAVAGCSGAERAGSVGRLRLAFMVAGMQPTSSSETTVKGSKLSNRDGYLDSCST